MRNQLWNTINAGGRRGKKAGRIEVWGADTPDLRKKPAQAALQRQQLPGVGAATVPSGQMGQSTAAQFAPWLPRIGLQRQQLFPVGASWVPAGHSAHRTRSHRGGLASAFGAESCTDTKATRLTSKAKIRRFISPPFGRFGKAGNDFSVETEAIVSTDLK
ncbi:MAG TPA: hypothetical protein VHU81_15150 [Thermoanaerobaculia bacterium]|jgi:hypothetical protein|nr:hypothetical protein [Thermoanaerobaculia bacterium]